MSERSCKWLVQLWQLVKEYYIVSSKLKPTITLCTSQYKLLWNKLLVQVYYLKGNNRKEFLDGLERLYFTVKMLAVQNFDEFGKIHTSIHQVFANCHSFQRIVYVAMALL